jgi:tungstate transport system substrate-binding protein
MTATPPSPSRRRLLALAGAAGMGAFGAFGGAAGAQTRPPPAPPLPVEPEIKAVGGAMNLVVADSAEVLVGAVLPRFEAAAGVSVRVEVVPAVESVQIARRGRADVLLLDDPGTERLLRREGLAGDRREVMYTEIVLVGPAHDPAGIVGFVSAVDAFQAIVRGEHAFFSRGDGSGVHEVEKRIWREAAGQPDPETDRWYRVVGADASTTLQRAAERNGFALADRTSWLLFKQRRQLVIAASDDPRLQLGFAAVMLSPERFPAMNRAQAETFLLWIMSKDIQEAIGAFEAEGERTFTPHRGLQPK